MNASEKAIGLLGVVVIVVAGSIQKSCSTQDAARSSQTAEESAAYIAGYRNGSDMAQHGNRLMDDRALDAVSKIRFPENISDQCQYRIGYRTGFVETPAK